MGFCKERQLIARKKWSPHELQLLRELARQWLDAQAIYDSNKLPGRSIKSIEKMLSRFYRAHKKFHAPHVNAGDTAELDEIIRRYGDAFRQLCEKEEWTRDELGRFNIILQASWKYNDLLAAG